MDVTTGWLTINRNCNNHCKWCYAQNVWNNTSIMDFEKAKRAVIELKKRGARRIILIGGEPTIYPFFFDIIRYIRENGLNVSVASNGRKFSNMEFARETVKAGITGIDISIKALTEEEYKENTGNYGFKQMIEGYNNLVALEFIPSVSYVITTGDSKRLEDLAKFVSENHMKKVSLQFVKPVIGAKEDSEEIMDIKVMGKFVETIYHVMEKYAIDYYLEISFPLCLVKREILDKLIYENRVINCCHVPSGTGVILDQDFKVLPCNHFAEFPFSKDSVDFDHEDSLEKIWESEIVKEFRRKARCYPATKCQTCSMWNECGGGCFTRWLFLNPADYIM